MFNKIYSKILNIEPIRRQSLITFALQMIFTVIGFVSTMYFARVVGEYVLGSYFLFLAYFSIIGLFANSGIGQAAIKRISEGIDQNEYFTSFIFLRTIFTTITILLLFIFKDYFVDLNESGLFIWLIVALIVSQFSYITTSGTNGCSQIGISSVGNFLNNVSRIVIQVIAVYLGYSIIGLIGGLILGMFIAFLFEIKFITLRLSTFKWIHVKKLCTFSIWIFLISSGWVVFTNIDTIMIGYYLYNDDIGIYRIVLHFTSIAAIATAALRSTLLPRISRWSITGEFNLVEDSLSRAITYSLLIALPVFVSGILLGDKLLYYFYGSIFQTGYIALIILFIVQIINVFHFLFTTYLTGLDKVKEILLVTVVLVCTNVVLNAILIPQIGFNGAALATLITMLIYTLLIRQTLTKLIRIKIEKECVTNILRASIAMGIVVLILKTYIPIDSIWVLIIIVLIGGIIYVIRMLNDETIKYEINRIKLNLNS